MSHFGSKDVFQAIDNPSSDETISKEETPRPEPLESWDRVEDSIQCAIQTLEKAMCGPVHRKNKMVSGSLRRLYSRSKKLRLARGKSSLEDKHDEENHINGSCMLGHFINGVY